MLKVIRGVWRVPTKQQYSYLEIEVEGTLDEVVSGHVEATALYERKQKEFDTSGEPFVGSEFKKSKMSIAEQNKH